MVDRLLSVLSEEERNLVVMKCREGYRNVEIAAELDMNPSTVSTRIFNAMAKMRSVASGW
jgi:DNA-directed RNA polymerase specialized sigma24 family protein